MFRTKGTKSISMFYDAKDQKTGKKLSLRFLKRTDTRQECHSMWMQWTWSKTWFDGKILQVTHKTTIKIFVYIRFAVSDSRKSLTKDMWYLLDKGYYRETVFPKWLTYSEAVFGKLQLLDWHLSFCTEWLCKWTWEHGSVIHCGCNIHEV